MPAYPFLSVQFSAIKYTHTVVQPVPLPLSKTFSLTRPDFDNTQKNFREQMQIASDFILASYSLKGFTKYIRNLFIHLNILKIFIFISGK